MAFFFGILLALRSASAMIHCSWPLVERNSSAAHASMASIISLSIRSMKFLVLAMSVCRLVVQRAGVHHGLCGIFAAEHHHEVADDRSLLIIV